MKQTITNIASFLLNLLIAIIIASPVVIFMITYFAVPVVITLLNGLDFINAVIDLKVVDILTRLGILVLTIIIVGLVLYLPFYIRRKFGDYLDEHQDKQIAFLSFTSSRRLKQIKKITTYFLLTCATIVFIFPMMWMISSSTKPDVMTYSQMGTLQSFFPSFSRGLAMFDGYKSVILEYNIWKYGINSTVYSVVIVCGNILVNSMAGYALAKYNFPGKRLIITIIIGLIIIPIETTIIPLYTIVHSLGLTGTVFAILIPPLVSVFNIFLFRQFFLSIPKELEEAALLDGASRFRVYWSIILPLSKPILATVATFTFIGVWNDYIWPIMVLPPPSGDSWPLYPIQAALNTIQQHPTITTMEVMASLTLTTIPLVIVYILAQKYIVEGLGHTRLK